MKRGYRRLLAPLLLMVPVINAAAQDQPLPPGAKLKVLDIIFRIEDLTGKVEDLQVKETDTEVRIEIAADVLFEFDKATLQSKAEETLVKAAALIQERSAGAVRIEGHTDSIGNSAYNQKLSERRADSVRQWFMRNGLERLKFSVTGFGDTRPVAPNTKPSGADDPDGRQKNRRVEIVIAKTG